MLIPNSVEHVTLVEGLVFKGVRVKILVTGATGFVGGWLVRELSKQGHSVRILVRSSSDLSELDGAKFETLFGDITDESSVRNALTGCEVVFHLAGVVGYSKEQRALMEKVNVEGTRILVNAILNNSVQKLIHMSSVVAIGASFDGKTPLNEESPFNIHELDLGYFETKRKAEEIVFEAVKSKGLNAVAVNPSTIYGAGDAKKGSRKVQLKVAQGRFPFYTPGGVNVIAIEDVIYGLIAAWEKGRKGERYILSGENITIKTLFEWIASEAGNPPPRFKIPSPLLHALGKVGDQLEKYGKKGPINSENAWTSTLYHWFDNSKAKRELGLNPRPAKEAIAASVKWIKDQGYLKQ